MDDRPDMAKGDAPRHDAHGDDVYRDDAGREPGDDGRQPVFNLPGILVASIVLLLVIYFVQEYLLGEEERVAFIVSLAFAPIRYSFPLDGQNLEWLWSPVSYSLLHGSIEHIGFNALWLAAFGAPVVRRIGAVRYLIFWALSSAAAAFFHAGLHWGDETILIGASGVVSALMGAACRFAFPEGGGYDRTFGHLYPRQSVLQALTNRTVLIFTGMWLLGNLLVAVGLPLVGGETGDIAWDAHIGGFLFGFLLFGLFDPIRYRQI